MAFVRETRNGFPIIAQEAFDGGLTAKVFIGTNQDLGLSVFADVTICRLPGGGRHDITFHILTRDPATGEEQIYWSSKGTKAFIPPEARKFTLECVLFATGLVIDAVRPERVEIVTWEADLPPEALVKYEWLVSVFRSMGYKITVCDPYHGKRIWWAELSQD